jgi:hypothetical protein
LAEKMFRVRVITPKNFVGGFCGALEKCIDFFSVPANGGFLFAQPGIDGCDYNGGSISEKLEGQ